MGKRDGSETLNAVLMISVLAVAALTFLAMSVVMRGGMRHHSGGLLIEHHEVPDVAPNATPVPGDAG